jgi:hypothetical protein
LGHLIEGNEVRLGNVKRLIGKQRQCDLSFLRRAVENISNHHGTCIGINQDIHLTTSSTPTPQPARWTRLTHTDLKEGACTDTPAHLVNWLV